MDGGTIGEARIALGGVAHKPWRDPDAEAILAGQAPTKRTSRGRPTSFCATRGCEHNAFKIELARRAIVRALTQAANGTPQSQSSKTIA